MCLMLKQRLWRLNDDYPTLVQWWTDWEFGIVPKECLPPDGIIVFKNDSPICATGLYIGTGTKFGFMEWVVVNKKAPPKVCHKALTLCIDSVIDLAEQKGMTLLYTVTGAEALHKRYTKYHGLRIMENNTKTFLKDIKNLYPNLDCFEEYEES